MDRTYIQSQHIVERYLSGDLSVREAREFEKYCQDNPDILNSLPIPVRVKAKMARKPGEQVDVDTDFDPTATSTSIDAAGLDDDEDDEPKPSGFRGMPTESRRWVVILGVAFLVASAGAGVLYFQNTALEKKLTSVQRAAKALQMQPPGSMHEYRVKPSYTQPNAPTVSVGAPTPPQLVELHVDMSESKYNMFLITIDNVAEGRVMQIRRVARDTNGEVRIGINSSAMMAGDYDIKFEGYTWRGETIPSGWIRLGMK